MITDHNSSAPQGRLFPGDMVIHAENAVIEEVTAKTEKTGYVLISYSVSDESNAIYMQEVRLNVVNNTIIMEENGVSLHLQDLTQGMRIDADFSAAMTRSIPPQSDAYRIVVLQEETPMYYTTTDRVVSVDTNNGLLLTGNPYDIYDQMVFNISDETEILDQNNNTIPLEAIQPGQMVQVEHAIFQTLSIPPQSPAYLVQIL
jgi:hypothetical protein